jgi:hypothetical protein
MTTWTVRLGLSLIVVVGFWANRLPAQEVLVVPLVPYEPALQPPPSFPFSPRPRPAPAPSAVHRCMNKHGVGCAADPYYPTCGSCHYEWNFAFGSCRWFFDQPCIPGHGHYRHGPR